MQISVNCIPHCFCLATLVQFTPGLNLFFPNRRYTSLLSSSRTVPRSLWTLPRSRAWWNAAIRGDYGHMWWKQNLRVDRSTFNYICQELRPHIGRRDTALRSCITVEERVAVTLWRLATNLEYRSISQLFGIGRSTACSIVLDTCHALEALLQRYVFIPSGTQMRANIDGFEARWGFPQAVGAIDGTTHSYPPTCRGQCNRLFQ